MFNEVVSAIQVFDLNPVFILLAITGTYLFTSFDDKKKCKKIYPLVPVIIGIIAAGFLTSWGETWVQTGIIHGAASTWIYDVVASLRKGKQ